jgi:ribosome-associated protein
MTAEGTIVITSSETRSQTRNREDATKRLVGLLRKSAIKPRFRKKTKPSLASKKRKIEGKKRNSALKKMRNKRIID